MLRKMPLQCYFDLKIPLANPNSVCQKAKNRLPLMYNDYCGVYQYENYGSEVRTKNNKKDEKMGLTINA
jgi:hypothetical protein